MKKNANEYKAWEVQMMSYAPVYEVNNDKCHNFYYHVKVRVYTGHKSFYRRNFVVWFDVFDLSEHYDKERFTKTDIKEYAKELAWSFVDQLPRKGAVTMNALAPFTEECRESIIHFNRIAA